MVLLSTPPEDATPFPDVPRPRRPLTSRVLVFLIAGMVCLVLAITSLWTWRTFADSEGFADVATDMLHDPEVQQLLAAKIADQLEQQPATARSAVSMRPAILPVIAAIVDTPQFKGLFHVAVREVHASVVQGHRSRISLDMDDAAPLVKQGLKGVNPTLAAAVPDGVITGAIGASQSTPLDTAMRAAAASGWLAIVFGLLALTLLLAAVAATTDRRRVVEVNGWCLLGLGVTILVLLHVGGGIASRSGSTPLEGHVLRAGFWSLTNLLSIQAAICITAGAVLALAAAYAGTDRLADRAAVTWQAMWRRLEQPGWKLVASLVLVAAALVAMVWPAAMAAVAVRVVAFLGIVAGAVGILDVVASRRWVVTAGGSWQPRRQGHPVLTVAVAVLASTAALAFFGGLRFINAVRAPAPGRASMAEVGCNGYVELCDRPIDEVALAATHNSMSASADGFFLGHHTSGITSQLAQGIRGFLVDLWLGRRQPPQERVRTQFTPGDEARSKAEASPEALAYAEKVLAMLNAADGGSGESEPYLCHLYCEAGATEADVVFRKVHDWLRENPNEVIIVMVEEHLDGEEAVAMFERSGLADRAYTLQPGQALPTLREMIESRHNVLFLSENAGGTRDWYHDAFGSILEETEYRFASSAAMTCAPERGQRSNPLLLVNHWLTGGAPDPVAADAVNARDFLVERLERCKRERGQVPNLVAVDFYDRGDVKEAIAHINDVDGPRDLFQAGIPMPS